MSLHAPEHTSVVTTPFPDERTLPMTASRATGATRAGAELPVRTLRQTLADVAPAVPAGTSGKVLLAAGAASASDGDVEIVTRVDWSGPSVLVPHADFSAVLEECVDRKAVVTLELDGGDLVVEVPGQGRRRIPAADPRGYAGIPEATRLKPLCRIPCDQFVRAVRGTVGLDARRPLALPEGTVLIEVADGACVFVARDGRRLSCARIEHDQAVDDASAVVPARAMTAAAAVAFRHPEDAVQLQLGDRQLVADLPGTTVSALLAEAAGLEWRGFVLEHDRAAVRVVVARARLFAAARAAATRGPSAVFEVSAGGVTLAGRLVPALHATGPGGPVSVCLPPQDLAGWLRCLTSEDDPHVSVEVTGDSSAVVLRCDDNDYTGVVMTMAREGGGDGGAENGTARKADHGRGGVFPALARPEPAGGRHRGALPGDARDGEVDGAPLRPRGAGAGARAGAACADPRRDREARRRGAGQVERCRP